MKRHIHILILSYLLLLTAGLKAQTTNTGELMVVNDTQFSVLDSFVNTSLASFFNDGEAFFYGNFANEGVVDYLSTTGLIRFRGSNQQRITGSQPSYLYNVEFNNTSRLENAIELVNTTLEVENNIDFVEGIVNTITNDGELVLQNGGTAINESNFSFVDGFMTKKGNNSFEFPVGDAGFYRFAGIGVPTSSSATYRARYVFKDQNNPYPIEFRIGNVLFLNKNEYWVIDNTQGSEQIEVTLSWDETTTTPANIVANQETIRMARWDFEQGAWRDAGGIVDTFNRTITSLQTIDGTAVFTVAGADLNLELPDGVVIWNAVSTNGNNKNDYFFIQGIEKLPNNTLEIYNRWGAEIFKTSNYDTNGNVFRGYAKGIDNKLLPSGTYFYILQYDALSSGQRIEKSGYLYLTTD